MAIESVFGELPEKWETTTLGEICQRGGGFIQTGPFGSQLHAADYVAQGIPSIMPQNIGDNQVIEQDIARITEQDAERLSKYRVKAGDIVYSRRGDVTRRALIREEQNGWLCGTGSLMVRLGEGIVDPKFVSYFLGDPSTREWIQRHAVGATMPNLNTSIMGAVPFINPPISEQRAIAGMLGALDDKIELNRRMNRTLESMVRAVFRQWFVEDLDLSKWEISKIGELGDLDKGVSYKGAFLTDEGMPMINLGCFQGKGKFDIEKLKTYSGEYKERHTVKPGDIVLANTDITQKREVIGSPAIVPDYPAKEYLFTHHTYALRVKDNSPVLKNYLYFTLLQDEFRERAEGFATGTTVLALPRDAVLDYEISMPPIDLLQKFYKQVHPMLQKVQSNQKESRTLASLRDSLLPKLMKGEVHAKDVEKSLEEP